MHAWALLRPLFRGRRLAAATAAVGLSTAGLIGFAGVASAHANLIHGAADCQSDGTYTVSWVVENDYNLSDDVTQVSSTGGGTLSGLPTTIAASPPHQPYKTATVTQTGVPGTATAASVTVKGTWKDGFSRTDTGQVSMNGRCAAVAPPTFVDATCTSSGSYTIPVADRGSYYRVDLGNGWTDASAGSVNVSAGATVNVRLMKRGHPNDTVVANWSHTFTGPGDCTTHVTPAVPTLTQSSCDGTTGYVGYITIPTTTGVVYEENGKPVSGDISVPGTHTITAVATSNYTLDGDTSWTLTLDAAPVCTLQQPSLSVTGNCNSVTYTFANDTLEGDTGPLQPAVVLGTQPAGPVTFDIYKSTDGGTSYAKVDSVTVPAGSSASKTEYGAGNYRVQIGNQVQQGSDHTVSGNCPVPPPPPASVVSVSGSVTSSCPTAAGKTGSYVVEVANSAQSTQSVLIRVSDGAKALADSGDIASGQSFSHTGTLATGQGVALGAAYSSDGGTSWTAVVLSGNATIVCPTVLGEHFNQPPAATPHDPSTPTQTLPFTGIPVLPTVLLALGLIVGGLMMVLVARRGRASASW
jgi:hypothetical protein